MSVYTVSVVARVLQFLQPVLVPVAFAGILAYLLQPLVDRMVKRGTPRFRAMMWVWIMFHLLILLLFLSVAVPTVSKGGRLIAARSDQWVQNIGNFTGKILEAVDKLTDKVTHFKKAPATPSPAAPPTVYPAPVTAPELATVPSVEGTSSALPPARWSCLPPCRTKPSSRTLPARSIPSRARPGPPNGWRNIAKPFPPRAVAYISSGVQGFLGIFGYLVGFILVPVYLYYFLKESDSIKQNWSNYVRCGPPSSKPKSSVCLARSTATSLPLSAARCWSA